MCSVYMTNNISILIPSTTVLHINNFVSKITELFPCFCRYTPEVRADIAKYVCKHGTQAASTYFSRRVGKKVSQSSVHLIKLSYVECMKGSRGCPSDIEVAKLPPKKHGQPLLLGKNVDEQVQLYLA